MLLYYVHGHAFRSMAKLSFGLALYARTKYTWDQNIIMKFKGKWQKLLLIGSRKASITYYYIPILIFIVLPSVSLNSFKNCCQAVIFTFFTGLCSSGDGLACFLLKERFFIHLCISTHRFNQATVESCDNNYNYLKYYRYLDLVSR